MPRQMCLTSVRFSMMCDIIKPTASPTTPGGSWRWVQNTESGAVDEVWISDNPATPAVEGKVVKDVLLFAEGVLDGGLRVAGTTERFDDMYENVDWIKAVFGKDTFITKRDRVTNIRNKTTKEVIWKEDEITSAPATTYDVMGVTPVIFMGKVIEQSVLLKRSEVQ